jgi:hypothetical protein
MSHSVSSTSSNETVNANEENYQLLSSQSSELSMLEDGPPTKRRRLTGPSIADRTHNVLDALEANGFKTGVDFLLGIFYGEDDLRADQRAKSFRYKFINDPNYPKLLSNQHRPARLECKGRRPSSGRQVLENWAFNLTTSILRQELLTFGIMLAEENFQTSETKDSEFRSLNQIVLYHIENHCPRLFEILSTISSLGGEVLSKAKLEHRVSSNS